MNLFGFGAGFASEESQLVRKEAEECSVSVIDVSSQEEEERNAVLSVYEDVADSHQRSKEQKEGRLTGRPFHHHQRSLQEREKGRVNYILPKTKEGM